MAVRSEVLELLIRVRSEGDKTAKSGLIKSLVDVKAAINMIVAAARQMARALEEAYEFGKLGAGVEQTARSFEMLGRQVGQPLDQLERLREATSGTVSDLALMAQELMLAGGFTDKVATAFAAAYPQLLEMSRAAVKLNPTLGDVQYMIESLSRGIKTQSYRLLDNLGLIVRAKGAYKEYAEAHDIAVSAMGAEENQLAMLAEVLRVGQNLIRQVGGDVRSLTDDYGRWEASTENLKNALGAAWDELVRGSHILPRLTSDIDALTAKLTLERLIDEAKMLGTWTTELQAAYQRLKGRELPGVLGVKATTALIDRLTLAEIHYTNQLESRYLAQWQATESAQALAESEEYLSGIEVGLMETRDRVLLHQMAQAEALSRAQLLAGKQKMAWEEQLDWYKQAADQMARIAEETYAGIEARQRETAGFMIEFLIPDVTDETSQVDAFQLTMMDLAEAAGASAYQLAALSGALRFLSADEVIAAAEMAALYDAARILAEQFARGEITAYDYATEVERLRTQIELLPMEKRIKIRLDIIGSVPTEFLEQQAAAAAGTYTETATGTTYRGGGVPEYQHGAWNIPYDQRAFLHAGEMVLPPQVAQQVRSQVVNYNQRYNVTLAGGTYQQRGALLDQVALLGRM